MRDYYEEAVNNLWPKQLPALTAAEAERAGLRLYKAIIGKPYTGRVVITSGRNHTYLWNGMRLNPGRGWSALVHGLSHSFHRRLHPGTRPHAIEHGRLERRMIQYVLDHGWLDGKLKPKPKAPPKPAPDPRQVKLQRTLEGIKRWTTKQKRATTALSKLERTRRRLEKQLAAA